MCHHHDDKGIYRGNKQVGYIFSEKLMWPISKEGILWKIKYYALMKKKYQRL